MTPETVFAQKAAEDERLLLCCLRMALKRVAPLCLDQGLDSTFFRSFRLIYDAAIAMWREGREFDVMLLPGNRQKNLEILYDAVSPSNADQYISNVIENHRVFTIAKLGQRLSLESFLFPSSDLLATIRETLDPICAPRIKRQSLCDYLLHALDDIKSFHDGDDNAVNFGIGLDDKAGPFCRGDLVVLAAQSGKGKSALAGNIVENVATAGGVCAVMSLEMSGIQNASRMLASQARVDVRSLKLRLRLRRGQDDFTQQDDAELSRLAKAIEPMRTWKVDMIEHASDIIEIVGELTRVKSVHGSLDLAVIDYAQLVRGIRAKGDSREREVASVSRELKIAAGRLNCVILLVSQLNEDGRLRESRALGQDANAVLELFHDDQQTGIRISKARSAPDGVEIPLYWRPQFTRFDPND